jgi:hypothetical protein
MAAASMRLIHHEGRDRARQTTSCLGVMGHRHKKYIAAPTSAPLSSATSTSARGWASTSSSRPRSTPVGCGWPSWSNKRASCSASSSRAERTATPVIPPEYERASRPERAVGGSGRGPEGQPAAASLLQFRQEATVLKAARTGERPAVPRLNCWQEARLRRGCPGRGSRCGELSSFYVRRC